MKTYLTPLYTNDTEIKKDLLTYLIENNIKTSAVPGEMCSINGVIVIFSEDCSIVTKFKNYPWVEYENNTYTFFKDGIKTGTATSEAPSLDDPNKIISVVFSTPEESLSFNSSAMYVQLLQK